MKKILAFVIPVLFLVGACGGSSQYQDDPPPKKDKYTEINDVPNQKVDKLEIEPGYRDAYHFVLHGKECIAVTNDHAVALQCWEVPK